MRTLTAREAATVRAALGLWQRTHRPSPAFVHTATDGNIFPPLDPEDIEDLIAALVRTRVCVTDVQSDVESFVHRVANADALDEEFGGFEELVDEAQALVKRLGA